MGLKAKCHTTDEALAANIANEGGAEGALSVLKNIMGFVAAPACAEKNGALPICLRLLPKQKRCRSAVS